MRTAMAHRIAAQATALGITLALFAGCDLLSFETDMRVSVSVDPGLIADGDQEILEDLILTAVNQGLDESRKLAENKLGPLAGGGLPV